MRTTDVHSFPLMSEVVTKCVLCEGADNSVLAEYPEMTWVRCACGLIYKQKYQAPEEAAERFDKDYFETSERNAYSSRTKHRIAKSQWQILDMMNHVEPGPLLDIGCSMGYALQAAKGLGLAASGTDISEYAVEVCKNDGFDSRAGTLETLPFEDNSFQMVIMKHVLEHTPDPEKALAETRRVIKDTGAVFIAVPNGGYLKARMSPGTARFFQPDGPGHDHFIYYTPETLTILLEKNGFQVAHVHPHFLHRHRSGAARLIELLTAPAKLLWHWAAWNLGLRKEFWIIAKPKH